MMLHPMLYGFVSLLLGVLGAGHLSVGRVVGALVVGAWLTGVAWKTRRGALLVGCGILLLVGALSELWAPTPVELVRGCPTLDGVYQARVDAPISRRSSTDPEAAPRQSTVLALEWERCGPRWQSRAERVAVVLPGNPAVRRGDMIQVGLTLRPLGPARNPTDPDPKQVGRSRGISGYASVTEQPTVVTRSRGPLAVIDALRAQVAHVLEKSLSPNAAALAKALALADRGGISVDERDIFADAGLAHLLAISGLHVGIVALFLFAMARFLAARLPGAAERFSVTRAAAAATLPALWVFCLWVGAPTSAIRATVMATAVLVALLVGHQGTAANALGLAGIGILLWNPASIYDVGFLLSFAAVGVLLAGPRLKPVRGWRRIPRYVLAAAVASLVVSLGTLPISAWSFGRVSVVAPIANVVGIPLGALITTPFALLLAVLAVVSEASVPIVAPVMEVAVAWLSGWARLTTQVPMAAVDLPRPTFLEIVAYLGVLVGLAWMARGRRCFLWLGVFGVGFLACVGFRFLPAHADELRILHPYVGQGDGAIIMAPNGEVILFDAGGMHRGSNWDAGRRVMAPLLRQLGVGRIDLAVVSHPHPDHLAGFLYLAEHFIIDELWHNGMQSRWQDELIQKVKQKGGRVREVAFVENVHHAGELSIEVLHPRPEAGAAYFHDLGANDNSVVLRLEYRGRSALFPGDVEGAAESLLLQSLEPTELLKLSHHGSRTSSTNLWLDRLRPRAVLASCGANNRFGFPHPEVLARLADENVEVFRTDLDGMVTWSTRGEGWNVEGFTGRRTWLPALGSLSSPDQ